eukprot:s3924_g4.t1
MDRTVRSDWSWNCFLLRRFAFKLVTVAAGRARLPVQMGAAVGGWFTRQKDRDGECAACQAAQSSTSRPPNREQIGRAAWRYVHAMAASFPCSPDVAEQVAALAWLRAFLRLYPCHLCAEEFIHVCRDLPPRFQCRNEYVLWWCEAHNRVRSDLSQVPRRCDLQELLSAGAAGATIDECGKQGKISSAKGLRCPEG